MGEAETRLPARGFASLAGAALLASGLGCATLTNPSATELPPVTEQKIAEEPPKKVEEPVAAPKPQTVVVIDEGNPDEIAEPQTLAEAAAAERDRRATAAKPVVRLDNKNLAEYGKDQKLTVASAKPASPDAGQAETLDAQAREEEKWRSRGLEIRKRWRDAVDRIDELEAKAEGLRRRFYAADDPYVRDGQIKPEWDKTLDDLDLARREAERGAEEVDAYMKEGREAGALPGWLREGIELEPVVEPLKAPTAEPVEPVELAEPPGNP